MNYSESPFNINHIYDKFKLDETKVRKNPMEQFDDWFADGQINETSAVSVSTVEEDGCPRTRMVLLNSYNWDGFIFYTHYDSRKGKAIEKTRQACLHFFLPRVQRQIIVKANLERIPENVSDRYFQMIPRGNQLSSLITRQSKQVPNRDFLTNKMHELEKEFRGKEIPRPEYWGGYLAKPYEIEFWQGRGDSLHDRVLYNLTADLEWEI